VDEPVPGRPCPRSDEVLAAPVWQLIEGWRQREGLSWRQAAQQLGFYDQGHLWQLKRRRAVTRATATRLLRIVAGLPRPPSAFESELARTWGKRRERSSFDQRWPGRVDTSPHWPPTGKLHIGAGSS
jgi:hypothetical protein